MEPKLTTDAVAARVNKDIQDALKIARMRDLGVYGDPANQTPEQLAA